ncbi:hypothetical protein PVAP13_1KG008050 [Panicum virgatum]|uniref:Uncharacterized protein n=1 Tax=Panicum virgatum TaxID=38727 RepID=A0A8T0X7I5_PANVG|nr:hypothetical protein PVAP13_1KG008050 [Panicum virgatum]
MVRDSERQKQEPKGSGGRWRCGRRGGAVPSGAEVAPPGHPTARRCWRPADRSPLADPARGGSGRRGGAASRSLHGRRRTKARWRSCTDGCGGCRRIQRSPPGEDKHGAELPAADPAWIGARGGRPRPARGRRHPGEFFTICCCSTATAADQIDLPRHLEDWQILDLPWRGWRARPPAIDISPGGR